MRGYALKHEECTLSIGMHDISGYVDLHDEIRIRPDYPYAGYAFPGNGEPIAVYASAFDEWQATFADDTWFQICAAQDGSGPLFGDDPDEEEETE